MGLFKPKTLSQAFNLALEIEETMNCTDSVKGFLKPHSTNFSKQPLSVTYRAPKPPVPPFRPANVNPPFRPANVTAPPPSQLNSKPVSNLTLDQKRALGLCFRCNDKWTQGHKCAKGLHTLEEEDEDVQPYPEALEINLSLEIPATTELMEDQLVAFSSLIGGCPHKTLKYKGLMGTIPICVLIDTGATSSFINPTLVSKLLLPTIPKPFKLYRSASGAKLLTDKMCPQVQFSLQNQPFVADLKVLNIPGYDVALGCDWIASLGDVKMNLMKDIMMIEVEGNLVTLHTQNVHAEVLAKDTMVDVKKEVSKGSQLFLAQLFQLEELSSSAASPTDQLLLNVISQFPQVFTAPVGLPPSRAIDHQI